MNVIIEFDARRPPILWTEIVKFDKILRTEEGRHWCDIHRHAKEILFNVVKFCFLSTKIIIKKYDYS